MKKLLDLNQSTNLSSKLKYRTYKTHLKNTSNNLN